MSAAETFEVQVWDAATADYVHIQTEEDVRLAESVARSYDGGRNARIAVRLHGAIVRIIDVEVPDGS